MPAPSRARVRRIRDRLREVYGRPIAPPHGQALDELILTVLSQSTSDRNRDVAFLRLRDRFGSWEAGRDAPNAGVEAAIRPGGISKVKSVRIQAILRELDGDDLSGLAGKTVEEGRAQLTALPGGAGRTPPRSRAGAARPPRASCCSRSASATCPWTPTSRASAPASACFGR